MSIKAYFKKTKQNRTKKTVFAVLTPLWQAASKSQASLWFWCEHLEQWEGQCQRRSGSMATKTLHN